MSQCFFCNEADCTAYSSSEDGPNNNIGREVRTKVNAAYADNGSPEQHQYDGFSVSIEQSDDIGAEPEGVGGMRGDETVETTATGLNQPHLFLELRMMTRTQPLENILEEMHGALIGQHHERDGSYHCNDESALTKMFPKEVGKQCVKWYGSPPTGDEPHRSIEPWQCAPPAIDEQEEPVVKVDQPFHPQ